MAAIISNLTAVAVLLHALLGCCWHHTHACARACPPKLSADHDHDGHGQAAACDGTDQPGHAGHEHPHPGKCGGLRCALDTSLVTKTPAASLQWLRGAGLAAALLPGDPSPQRPTLARADDGGSRPPSVRPHLLNRVLLL